MTAAVESRMTSLFDQAMQTYGEAMKATVKMQEDAAKWWGDVLEQGGAMQSWQRKSRAIVSDVIPAAQKSTEEMFKVIEQNYRRSMELLKKAVEADPSGAAADLRSRTQEMWEAYVSAVRDGTQAMTQAGARFMEQMAEILKKNANGQD